MSVEGETRRTQASRRRLFSPPSSVPARALLGTSSTLVDIARRAGQEALRCAGPAWSPASNLTVSVDRRAAIAVNLSGLNRIVVTIEPTLLCKRSGLPKSPELVPIRNIENAIGASVALFAAHLTVCPRDSLWHDALLRAAERGAYGARRPSRTEAARIHAVVDFFERSLAGFTIAEREGAIFAKGIAAERSYNRRNNSFLYWLFERVVSLVLPDAWKISDPTYSAEEAQEMEALLPWVVPLIFQGVDRVGGRLRRRGPISIPPPWKWPERVEKLAAILEPSLEDHRPSNLRSGDMPTPFGPSGRHGGRGGAPSSDSAPTSPASMPGLNPSTRQPGTTIASVRDRSRGRVGGIRPGTSGPRTVRSYRFEALDDHFTKIAKKIGVRDGSTEHQSQKPDERATLGYLGHEPASIKDLMFGRIAWSRTQTCSNETGFLKGLKLRRFSEPLTVPITGGEPGGDSVPHLCLCCDSSGSMQFNFDPPLVTGPFSLVLTAAWGVFKQIEESPHVDSVQVLGMNFSHVTKSSGWQHVSNIAAVKQTIAAYQGGGTVLDPTALRQANDTCPGPFLLILITDGHLANTDPVLAEIRELLRCDNHVVLLHIGTETQLTEGLRQLGCPVHVIQQPEDLIGLCLNVAQEVYTSREGEAPARNL